MHGVLAQESGPIRAVFGSFENTSLWVILGISLVALLFAYYLVREVLGGSRGHREDEGDRQGDPGGGEGLPLAAVPDARRSSWAS